MVLPPVPRSKAAPRNQGRGNNTRAAAHGNITNGKSIFEITRNKKANPHVKMEARCHNDDVEPSKRWIMKAEMETARTIPCTSCAEINKGKAKSVFFHFLMKK